LETPANKNRPLQVVFMLALRTGIEPFEITPKSLGIKGSLLGVLNFVLNVKRDRLEKLW